jgi:membrane-bound lytic murein transglycosylase B
LLQQQTPGCHVGWTTLAAIGEIESDHGRAGGAVLGDNGRSIPPILGPALDGKDGRALVKDTDAGAYDGDSTYDHLMGPLHLLPSVWAAFKTDADNDGILDPYDIDDASAALARLLCSGPEDMNTLAGWKTAIARYHLGDQYETAVFKAADSYGQRSGSVG